MTRAGADGPVPGLTETYATALHAWLDGAGEAALTRAYELGRRAANEGVGLLDLALVHHAALALLPALPAGPSMELAGQFLAEALSPYEMTLRAYQEHARLLGLGASPAERIVEIDHAREQLRTILDATTAVIYLKDAEGRYQFVNRQFLAVFGLDRDRVLGSRDADVLPSPVAALLSANDRRVLELGSPHELEETLPQPDGVHTFISLKFPLLDKAGAPNGICCVATDISERKRADDALRRAKEAAEDANRELESFSYSVAHDLRAPLRSMDGFSKMLLDQYQDQLDEQGRRYLAFVRRSAQQMGHLIDDLLALSRVTRGDMHRQAVDLSAVVHGVLERLQASAPERRADLVIEPRVIAHGDARLLAVALENLIGNAWKFTARREGARIEFGRYVGAGGTVYYVRDNGAGFDMAHYDKLFGVFQRLHPANEFEGTGIGLATVQRIIRRHGGRVWAEAEEGRGAAFYFTLGAEA